MVIEGGRRRQRVQMNWAERWLSRQYGEAVELELRHCRTRTEVVTSTAHLRVVWSGDYPLRSSHVLHSCQNSQLSGCVTQCSVGSWSFGQDSGYDERDSLTPRSDGPRGSRPRAVNHSLGSRIASQYPKEHQKGPL